MQTHSNSLHSNIPIFQMQTHSNTAVHGVPKESNWTEQLNDDVFRECHGQERELRVLALPSTNSVTLGKLLTFLSLPFLISSMASVIVLPSQHQGAVHEIFVQLLSHVPLFATPWTVVRQASLSFTVSQNLLTHVLWFSDAIQPYYPLSPPSPPAVSLSQQSEGEPVCVGFLGNLSYSEQHEGCFS